MGNWLKKLKEKVIRSQFALEIPLARRQGIAARKQIIKSNFSDFELPFEDGLIDALVECTENFSGADLKGFAQKVKRKAFASNAKICDRALFQECLSGIYPSSNADLMSNIRKWESQFNV